MNIRQSMLQLAFILAVFACAGESGFADDIRVLHETVEGVPTGELLQKHLLSQADQHFKEWRQRYERIKTVAQAKEYQQRQREFCLKQLGSFPERKPLNPQITGKVSRPGINIEKIIYESRPKHYVTGVMFLPDEAKFPKPWPGVLVVCGHSANGKGYDGYQRVSMLLALNGMGAFLIDPICQGERFQFVDSNGKQSVAGATTGHSLVGLGSILLGRNTASFEIWDGMRGIDYLQSRDDIDSNTIGCTGNSGGGTQTSYLMALDDRIQVAAPSCYLTTFERLLNTIGPQDAEQNIYAQLEFGMDHADYILMRAPKPTLICAATQDFFDISGTWDSFRNAKRFYGRFGVPENVSLAENDDKHGFKQPLREAAVQWLRRWLRGVDGPVKEPELQVLTDKEIQCTERGQVQLMDGALSVLDINRSENHALNQTRNQAWARSTSQQRQNTVRQLVGMSQSADLSKQVESVATIEIKKTQNLGLPEDVTAHKVVISRESGVPLPGVLVSSPKSPHAVELVFHPGGINQALNSSFISDLIKRNHSVAIFDVSGVGETSPTKGTWYRKDFGHDAKPVTVAYLLGRSFVGIRGDDMTTVALAMEKKGFEQIKISAEGYLGIPALHAAYLHPELIDHVTVNNTLSSFSALLDSPKRADQWRNIIHGVLKHYDLPMLVDALEGRVTVKSAFTPAKD